MPTLIELPDNATALLKTSEELTNREVKTLRRAARKVGIVGQHLKDLGLDNLRVEDTEADPESDEAKAAADARNVAALSILTQISDEEDDDLDLFQRTCAAVRIIEWSLDLPLPKTPEDVDNLPRAIYGALTVAAADIDLNDSFGAENAADPKVTEGESVASEPPSEAVL